MSYLEVFYNPASCDWDEQADKALEEIDYIPNVILCFPRADNRQLQLFKTGGIKKTDEYHTNSFELSGK